MKRLAWAVVFLAAFLTALGVGLLLKDPILGALLFAGGVTLTVQLVLGYRRGRRL